ncbi:MAG: hypothetical protein MZV70_71365, partial [Desulfobacterales bacterium]|nr:hypothetical protein [Desulfobacterales bacterium]
MEVMLVVAVACLPVSLHGLRASPLGRLALFGVLCRLHRLSHHGCRRTRRPAGVQPSDVDVRTAAAGGNGVRYCLQVADTTAMKRP